MDLTDTERERRRARARQAVLARAGHEPDTSPRYAASARWRLLAAAGLLDPSDPVPVDAPGAEAVGAALPGSPYLDVLFAVDLLSAAGDERAAARVRAGVAGAAVAVDERLAATPGTTTGTVTVDDTLTGLLRHVRHADRADLLVVVTPGRDGAARIATVPTCAAGLTVPGGPAAEVRLTAVAARQRALAPSTWPRLLAAARVRLAAYLVGIAETAVVTAERHAARRRQFGAPLASFQAVSFPLAAAAARTEGARMLSRYAASTVHRDLPGHEVQRIAAQALATAARVARTATALALHVHGSVGLTDRADVADLHRHVHVDALRLGTPRGLDRLAGAALAAHDGLPHRFFGADDR
ncbi:acyl-CoA dehydrogenase family protein [Micromonospora sp. RP3T]|uniref:acyl-CoA dehydrogenase family protein n=1 Tax=Micromonospora sp. RP3T TaxID=2135446 RepID=UPI000D17353A|nr:acyl-CoA dehydrogenase family protein [Micromonospora sp. RP3T]PTA46535.1 hypothetical protein C8054_09095 [Micromonospora sp. RP3T]